MYRKLVFLIGKSLDDEEPDSDLMEDCVTSEILDFELGAMIGRDIELFLLVEKEVYVLYLAKKVKWIFEDQKRGLAETEPMFSSPWAYDYIS